MAKVALLVDFVPRTRVVIDVPDNMTVERYLENNDAYDALAQQARNQMCEEISGYLNGENMEWQEDMECPFGTFRGEE